MEPVPLGPRPRAGEACHGCWEESPLPGMRPTGRWDRSRLKGEKGPLGAVGAPEPSLCAGSLGASPPRARSPPGERSPHARRATAMEPTACSRAGTTRSGSCPPGRARCGRGPTAGDAAHWVQSQRRGTQRGCSRWQDLRGSRLRGLPLLLVCHCEASLPGTRASARRPLRGMVLLRRVLRGEAPSGGSAMWECSQCEIPPVGAKSDGGRTRTRDLQLLTPAP